ncbi:MAG TPA: ABC transporter permease subunit [Solirubrobacteraceae bacterium]|nr:ABC transporter permease subunit [Solirubrobacteraceae bacterium]
MSSGATRLQARTAPRSAVPPPWRVGFAAVVRQGLRDRRRSVVSWGGSLGALGAFMAAVYPSVQKTIEQVAKSYPAGLKQAFGVTSMDTVEGYIHAELFSLIVPLALGFFAIRAVTGATVAAEEAGHLDTILALPISRRVIIVAAWVVAAVSAAAVMIVMGVLTFIAGRIAGTHISAGLVAAGVTGVWALALLFAGVAAAAAGALHSSRLVSGLSLGVLIGMYALDLVGRLASSLDAIRWASAFRYYGAPLREGLDVVSSAGMVAVGVALLIAGTLLFDRRDILGP